MSGIGGRPALRRRIGLVVIGSALLALALSAPAAASFHLLKIREIYAGGANSDYIALQQPATGENQVQTHEYNVYDELGAITDTFAATAPAGSGQNQRTILYGDTGVNAQFGVAPDFVDAELALDPVGGAVCWADGTPPDCVAWGNFSGTTLPAPGAGTPVSPGGITAGKAIRRSIAAGCPTALETTDDTNDSAADFDEVDPAPRANSQAPLDMPCPPPPNTTINMKPANPTNSTTAGFTYSSTPSGATFECRLDDAPAFTSCPASGISYMGLANGSHTFRVRAVGPGGTDATPATYTWTIDTTGPPPAPDTTITGGPKSKTKDRTPTFRFTSDQTGVSYKCKVDSKPYKACSSPHTTAKLSFGKHRVQIRATGPGGPDPTPAKRSFKVIKKR
jgi:hypothetical protein